jgi:hypothetical protein
MQPVTVVAATKLAQAVTFGGARFETRPGYRLLTTDFVSLGPSRQTPE